jgi:pimeloyl-ACP methyl ester carboxylesterase
VRGREIHWTESGAGDTILLIHGLGGNLHNFNYMVPELSKNYRVVCIDRPGSGWSTRQSIDYASIDAQTDAIAEFIEKEALERPLVVGHSLGGTFTISLGIKFPDRIKGLALICPASMAVDQTPEVFRDLELSTAAGRKFVANVLSEPLGLKKEHKFLAEIFKPEPILTDFGIKGGAVLGRLPRHFQTTCEDLVSAKSAQEELMTRLDAIKTGVYVIFAEDDNILDAQHHGKAFCEKTGAKLVMIPKTGHMLPATNPQLCNKFIQDIMSSS